MTPKVLARAPHCLHLSLTCPLKHTSLFPFFLERAPQARAHYVQGAGHTPGDLTWRSGMPHLTSSTDNHTGNAIGPTGPIGSLRHSPQLDTVPALPSRRGFTRQPENSKRTHLRAPALQTPPKFQRRPPEREKERKWGREREKKARNFGPPHPSSPHPSGGGPPGLHFFWVWAPTFLIFIMLLSCSFSVRFSLFLFLVIFSNVHCFVFVGIKKNLFEFFKHFFILKFGRRGANPKLVSSLGGLLPPQTSN